MISNAVFLALGVAALLGCAWALKYYAGSDAGGRTPINSLVAMYALIYGVMLVGGTGLIFVGYGFGLDDASTRAIAKRAATG